MQPKSELIGIVLAAGRSRRFGGDKLLHPLADGTPMVLASIKALRAVLPRTVAVVRADNRALTDLFADHHIETVVAEHADAGMGASLAAGVAATADASGWLVALGDMPFIQPHTVARVVNELQSGARLAAPGYQGRRGHPVGFSVRYRDPLLRLSGDEGARNLLRHHAAELVLVDCGDPGVLRDIDQR
jgi:molybdenum cofactor cytidylyltransferase